MVFARGLPSSEACVASEIVSDNLESSGTVWVSSCSRRDCAFTESGLESWKGGIEVAQN